MQKTLKHSKQRDAVLSLLKSVYTHPTADWLHQELRKSIPNLSLATVYRNLNLLCETGNIIKIDIGDGTEHYDANTKDHCHMICANCHSVIDINVPSALSLKDEAQKLNDIKIFNSHLSFSGLCQNCK